VLTTNNNEPRGKRRGKRRVFTMKVVGDMEKTRGYL
jgi:hypothetical protein